MFDLRTWLKNSMISAYQSGHFAKEQVEIYAGNHLMRGSLTAEDIEEIAQALEPIEEEPIA